MASNNEFTINKLLDKVAEELETCRQSSHSSAQTEYTLAKPMGQQQEKLPEPEQDLPD